MALVGIPDEVAVRKIEDEQTTVLPSKLAQDELGQVIGNYGRTFHSIQKILSVARMKSKKQFVLELSGSENGWGVPE